MRVLVAGVGNVFLGDDGFGCEVARAIGSTALPAGVDVADYGIRGVHLAYELLDGGYGTLIMIDAAPVGGPPGTLAVLEVDPADPGGCGPLAAPAMDAHSMHPLAVLQVMQALGGRIGRVLVVGCQPGELAAQMGLSPPVRAAVPGGVSLATAVAAAEAASPGLPAAAPPQAPGQRSERRPARA